MKFTENIIDLFLKGAQIVSYATWTAKTYLLRMPKNEFVEYDGIYFEYVWIQNYLEDKELLLIGGYYNGGLRDAKKHMYECHREHTYSIYRKQVLEKEKQK